MTIKKEQCIEIIKLTHNGFIAETITEKTGIKNVGAVLKKCNLSMFSIRESRRSGVSYEKIAEDVNWSFLDKKPARAYLSNSSLQKVVSDMQAQIDILTERLDHVEGVTVAGTAKRLQGIFG